MICFRCCRLNTLHQFFRLVHLARDGGTPPDCGGNILLNIIRRVRSRMGDGGEVEPEVPESAHGEHIEGDA